MGAVGGARVVFEHDLTVSMLVPFRLFCVRNLVSVFPLLQLR